MVCNRARRLFWFIVLIGVAACQESVPPSTPVVATETAVSPDTTAEASFPTTFDQTRVAEFEARIDEMDEFSRDLINLMLDSHNRWQTMQAEVRGQWTDSDPQILQHTILIRQPYLAHISGDYQALLGEDDTARQRIDQGLELLPGGLDEVQPMTIYIHPLSTLGLGFSGDNIFPTGLAQRGGRYELITEETFLERPAWVVDWYDVLNGNEKRNRFWIDQATGLILKSWGYGVGEITEEIEFISLALDEPIPDEAFQVSEELVQASRTVDGRIVTADGTQQPVPAVQLQLEPGGEFVTETVGDGRFSLTNLPFEEITVFADHFQFTIPAGDAPQLDLGDIEYPTISPPLTPENYPPNDTPYHFENSSFWLVHTPEGQLMAFSPVSPEYDDRVRIAECQFFWAEANNRFNDPCSGDEWELNGRLNLEHSGELWSNRNLDQYHLSVMDGQIFIQFDRLYQGLPVNEPPLAADSQFGVTMTVTTADFNPTATSFTTLTQVDPIWDMDPKSFPPQQALTYMTFPDSLFDDQGRTFAPVGGQGGLAVFDPGTGGMQQNYHLQWEPVAASANSVTATLTTDLSSIYRQVTIQPNWEDHQEGDIWEVDIPLEIGHAAARVRQLEWLKTVDDGRIRLRLTVVDDSPAELNLYCLHLDTEDPWRRTCANFAGELDYLVVVPAEEAVTLHLRAGVELVTPFQFVLPVGQPEAAAYDVPALDAWLPYENPALGLALRYPPDWTVTERGNGLTLTAPQTAVIDSEEIPWTIWISAHPKFAEDASLFEVIVNEYHFPDVIERFEETLTGEMVNDRMAYRSTIIPAIGGQQSVFFEDGDRFVGVTLRPFDEERPYENQPAFAKLFMTLLETVMLNDE